MMLNRIAGSLLILFFLLTLNVAYAQSDLMSQESTNGYFLQGGLSKVPGGLSTTTLSAGISVYRSVDVRLIWGSSGNNADYFHYSVEDSFYGFELGFYPSKDWQGDLVTADFTFGMNRINSNSLDISNYSLSFGISKNLLEGSTVLRPIVGAGMLLSTVEDNVDFFRFLHAGIAFGNTFFIRPSYNYFLTQSEHLLSISAGIIIH